MKQERTAIFYLPPGLTALLRNQIRGRAGSEPLLINKNGKRLADFEYDVAADMSKRTPISPWRKVFEAASVPLRGVHQLRGGVATHIVTLAIEQAVTVTQHSAKVCKKHYSQVTAESQRLLLMKIERSFGLDAYAVSKHHL